MKESEKYSDKLEHFIRREVKRELSRDRKRVFRDNERERAFKRWKDY